jgi:hypothetical protein
MPRVSQAALTVVGRNGLETVRRPEPPGELTDEEAQIWKNIVNGMAADWFPAETHDLLTQYCRLIIKARRIAELTHAYERKKKSTFSTVQYCHLIREEANISKSIGTLARLMRLNQASTYKHDYVKKRPFTLKKPWDRDEEDDDEGESTTKD